MSGLIRPALVWMPAAVVAAVKVVEVHSMQSRYVSTISSYRSPVEHAVRDQLLLLLVQKALSYYYP